MLKKDLSRTRLFDPKEQRPCPYSNNNHIKNGATVVDTIDSIKVTLRQAPSWNDLRKFVPDIVMATWANVSDEYIFSDEAKDCLIYRAMSGKFLPQVMEYINLVYSFDGITSHDITHLLRTRTNTPAVECTSDSLKNTNDVSMSNAWTVLGLDEKYKQVIKVQEDLYAEAINAGMSILEAREILPRMMHQFAIIRIPFNNVKTMAMQRLDMQIQPPSDWIFAAKMILETCKVYLPFAVIAKDYFQMQNKYYVTESATNFASKFFKPLPQNKTADTEKMQTYLDCTPIEAPGHDVAYKEYLRIQQQVEKLAEEAKKKYPHIWSDKNKELYK